MDINAHERSIRIGAVDVAGRLDALEAPAMREALDRLLAEGYSNVVVDLSEVEYVDSAGLAALVKGMKDAKLAGGDLQLVKPRRADAMRVFRLTRFDRVFTMLDAKPGS